MKINVTGGTLGNSELKAYEERARKKYGGQQIERIDIALDGEYAEIKYTFPAVPFERIRRITGYLVGTTDRFNNAKQAEVKDRLKHKIGIGSCAE